MKTNLVLVVMIAILLTSCTPTIPAQEIEATHDVAEVTITPELVVTQELTATETPTKAPSMTPLGCMTLLIPLDGTALPAMGKVTFSWSPMNGASFYVLNIILPSGVTVSFETKQTFRNQYMEAFSTGGSYQWKVTAIAQDRKRNEICSSQLATFSKPAGQPQPIQTDDRKKR